MRIMIVLGVLAIFLGCSEKPADPPEAFFKAQKQVLDEAKNTEALLKAADDKRRKQLEEIQM